MARRIDNATTAGTSKLTVTAAASINNLTAFTWLAWVMPLVAVQANGQRFMAKGSSVASKKGFGSQGSGAGPAQLSASVVCATTNAAAVSLQGLLQFNKWQIVAFSYDTTSKIINLYYGGPDLGIEEVTYVTHTTGVGAETSDAADNLIIGNSSDNAQGLGGVLSWVGVAGKRMTLSEIEQFRVNPLNNDARFSWKVLLPLYGIASPETDLSGNGNTGALTGTVALTQICTIPTYELTGITSIGEGIGPIPIDLVNRSPVNPCDSFGPNNTILSLPRANGDADSLPQTFDDAMAAIEDKANNQLAVQPPCDACPTNGALNLDLSTCQCFNVNLTSPISAITVNNAQNGQTWCVTFTNNTGAPITIGGWPDNFLIGGGNGAVTVNGGGGTVHSSFYVSGNRGASSAASAGPGGAGGQRHLEKGGSGIRTPMGGSGGGGGTGPLRIDGPTCFPCLSSKSATYTASGGVGPYTWSITAGVLSAATGSTTTLTPAANAGAGVAGNAYTKGTLYTDCGHSSGTDHACNNACEDYGCNDQDKGNASPTGSNDCGSYAAQVFNDPTCACSAHTGHNMTSCVGGSSTVAIDCSNSANPALTSLQLAQQYGVVTDIRTAGMISSGCAPCGITLNGAVLTLTDARSVSVTKTIKIC